MKAAWYKEIGDDSGACSIRGGWVWFDCLVCAKYLQPVAFLSDRWQGPPSKAIVEARRLGLAGGMKVPCLGKEIHKKFKEKL